MVDIQSNDVLSSNESNTTKNIDSEAESQPSSFNGFTSDSSSSNIWTSFKDSFKPAIPKHDRIVNEVKELNDLEKAVHNTNNTGLKKELSLRHLMMIVIGGCVGTGLFVNSGGALSSGGPASLIIGWSIVATMMFTTSLALGELCVTFPHVSGGFTTFSIRFIDPSFGFAIAWNYALQWLILLPLELVAAAITINYWNSEINSDAWVAIFYVFIFILNLLDVKYYAESEVILSSIKLIATVGFFILGIVLICGGGVSNHTGYIGGKYWHNPGAFSHGFKGFCSVFVTAAFSFAGTELIGTSAAAETKNPRETIPRASKQSFWLVTIVYIVTLTLISCLVPYNDERLLNGSSYASVSPFVIAIQNGNIKGLPSVMNAVILIAILSVANSAVYACSRVLASLADVGHAPKILSYVDRRGRPIVSILFTMIFGLLSFIAASDKQGEVFTWLSALSGLSTIFAWLTILISHIRFRMALKAQGRNIDELTYTSPLGIWGSIYGIILNFVVIMGQFWVALFPTNKANAKSFFEIFLSLALLVVFYFGHKVWRKNWIFMLKLDEVDIDTGREHVDMDLLKQEIIAENQRIKSSSVFYRVFRWLC